MKCVINTCNDEAVLRLIVFIPLIQSMQGVWFARGPFCVECEMGAVSLLADPDTQYGLQVKALQHGVNGPLQFSGLHWETYCSQHVSEQDAIRLMRSKMRAVLN